MNLRAIKLIKSIRIAVEGGDGSGKTEISLLLKQVLAEITLVVHYFREPGGGTILGEKVRSIVLDPAMNGEISHLSESYLFATARAELRHSILAIRKSEKKNGEFSAIVTDRSIYSSLAMQGRARGLGYKKVLQINAAAIQDVMPDITILLQGDPKKLFARASKRNVSAPEKADRMEMEGLDFQIKVHAGYEYCRIKDPEKFIKINAELPLEQVKSIVIKKLITFMQKNAFI